MASGSEELRTMNSRTASSRDQTSRSVPMLLTAKETADVLRTSPKAVYMMIERAQLPGVVRIGRRVLIEEDALVDWLRQKSAPLPKESR